MRKPKIPQFVVLELELEEDGSCVGVVVVSGPERLVGPCFFLLFELELEGAGVGPVPHPVNKPKIPQFVALVLELEDGSCVGLVVVLVLVGLGVELGFFFLLELEGVGAGPVPHPVSKPKMPQSVTLELELEEDGSCMELELEGTGVGPVPHPVRKPKTPQLAVLELDELAGDAEGLGLVGVMTAGCAVQPCFFLLLELEMLEGVDAGVLD